jgi:hypothetical protein
MKLSFLAISICLAMASAALGQEPAAPDPQPAHISGTVTDANGDIIPGAAVALEDALHLDKQTVTANDTASFQFDDVKPGVPYRLTITAPGFTDWRSDELTLAPGQFDSLTAIKLVASGNAASVIVSASSQDIAVEELKMEEQQRVLGFIPNYYVVYDPNAPPLTSKMKFQLAVKVMTNPITFAGTGFLAALNQASNFPDYQQGMKGYGQRFGSIYADGLTDIMVGGAILPSLLHQDPRYFYQGTGTSKSRLLHAMSSPFICKGDNGHWQPNYSSLGGYLASGAVANAYYPQTNRGTGLVLNTFFTDIAGNVADSVIQEFVLRRFTPSARNHN